MADNSGQSTEVDRTEAILLKAAAQVGTPTYVYLLEHVRARVEAVRDAFGQWMGISYAVKANPNRALLRHMVRMVDHLDVSSGGEILLGKQAGADPASFTFVGPAKADWELRLALDEGCGVIVCESDDELTRVNEMAAGGVGSARVALRINPTSLPEGFGVSMSRRATVFGIDEEAIHESVSLARELPAIDLVGFHVYAGTQCLRNDSLARNLSNIAALYTELITRHALQPSLLVFGSGFGIPYHDQDRAIDLATIVEECGPDLSKLHEQVVPHGGRLTLELGRYLIGEAGYYLTRVVGLKDTRGREIAAVDGGMNHHLAASGNLGGVIKRNYPIRNISRLGEESEPREYDLAGPMCTNIDVLGRAVSLPPTRRGDVLAIGSSGAYGPTASPLLFISHRPPSEVLVLDGDEGAEELVDITDSGTFAQPIRFPDSLGSERA